MIHVMAILHFSLQTGWRIALVDLCRRWYIRYTLPFGRSQTIERIRHSAYTAVDQRIRTQPFEDFFIEY